MAGQGLLENCLEFKPVQARAPKKRKILNQTKDLQTYSSR